MIVVKNQRFVAPEQWDAQILCDHPAYRWLCAALPLSEQSSFPTPAVLTDWLQQLHLNSVVGFVDALTCQHDPRYYEVFIADTQQVPTRTDNWHDLFGACIWTLFPNSKQALNQRHLSEIALHGSKNRSALRHQLTLFDECGVLLLCPPDQQDLVQALRAHLWQQAFWSERDRWHHGNGVTPLIFGHANYEMLTRPFIGLTAKLWPLSVPAEFCFWSLQQQLEFVDTALSKQIAEFTLTDFRQQMSPLPLLGIPGWYQELQTAVFYQDVSYFRPKRQATANGL
ncbi:DUF3025 domain-containing protein [Rheinheimera sp.]|uniref:DUF3025 domain-containing protein n=1 Tax=Rheinheimera sp. TaxID=1869214 RepID=UPI003D2DA76B